jgi:hypothetical protein
VTAYFSHLDLFFTLGNESKEASDADIAPSSMTASEVAGAMGRDRARSG